MSKGKLNITRDTFLEKEELDRLINFINDNPALFLFVQSTQQFGIIAQDPIIGSDPAFKIEAGDNTGTVKVGVDSYALNKYGQLIYQRAFDNLPVPDTDTWFWMKISHRYDNYEQGFVDIAADGTLSGSGTSFTEVLRGNSSGFPVKVRFFVQAADGSLSSPDNDGIYEVTTVAGDNTAILAGNFSPESELRYVVLGAFSIRTSIGSIESDGLYAYDSCQIDFIAEEVSETPPVIAYTAGEDFYIAAVYKDSGTGAVEIVDVRNNYYFRLNFGDIIVDNKADTTAGNLTAGNVTSWLAKLSVYTQAEVTSALTAFLAKAQNLNDLANKATARTNLDVYATGVIDLRYPLRNAYVNLGDWNMDTDALYPGAELLWATIGIDPSKVYDVRCIIKADVDVLAVPRFPLDGAFTATGTTTLSGSISWGGTAGGISLNRTTGGHFDGVDFNSTGYSRGWVIIYYSA